MEGLQIFATACQERTDDASSVPSWFVPRPPSVTDAYGVVGKPVYVDGEGKHVKNILTGGWRGRHVNVPCAKPSERSAELWCIPKSYEQNSAGETAVGERNNSSRRATPFQKHGWVFPIGPPWFLGRVCLPSGLLLFLASKSQDEISDVFRTVTEPTRSVLTQFESKDDEGSGVSVLPCLLFRAEEAVAAGSDTPENKKRRKKPEKRIELFESAVRRRAGTCGLFIRCGCDNAGGLQCSAYATVLEPCINEALGGNKFSRLDVTTSTDGLTLASTWTVSGCGFHWATRTLPSPIRREQKGKKYVHDYNITG